MRARAAILFTCLALAACGEGVSRDSPFAPGVASDGEAVDGIVVGNRLIDAGEYDLAIDAFTRAALTRGMDAEVLAGIGTASIGLGRLHTAEDLLRRAIELDEDEPEYWNNLGVVLIERGQAAEAEQVFRRAYAFSNGESDSIRDNLRLAMEKIENPGYDTQQEQDYNLVRRGTSDYVIRKIP